MKKLIIGGIVFLFVIAGVCLVLNQTKEKKEPNPNNGQPAVNTETQTKEAEVNLYYANNKYIETGDEGLEKLIVVKKKVKYGQIPLAEAAVRELFNNPNVQGVSSAMPADAKLISIKVEGDTAYVDFASEGLAGGSLEETMTINQIVSTLTDLPGINKVQFLKDGKKAEDLMGHSDITEPFTKKK